MSTIITPEAFFRKKSFPVGISDEDWEKWKITHKGTNWQGFAIVALVEYAELYHSRKCEEAGKELPAVEFVPHYKQYDSNEDGAAWMKAIASKLLASLQSQLEAKDKEIQRLKVFEPTKTEGCMTIHSESRRNISVHLPKTIPMNLLNEEQANHNHGQSLERLNARGGLGVGEILDIIHRRTWGTTDDSDVAAEELLDILKKY